jgi:hypothetical protein
MPNAPDRSGWVSRGLRIFDPAARAARKRRRARRSLGYRAMATFGLAYLASTVGVETTVEFGELFWGTASIVAAAGTVGAAGRVWRIERAPRPVHLTPAPALPPESSAARTPLSRLTARENALGELLTVLGPVAGDTWAEASAAAQALRRLGDQMVVLEAARAGVPIEARPGLDSALSALRLRLEEGVSAYDRMVCAATDAVAAAAGGHGDDVGSVRRLADAADNLTGLARGLREVAVLPRQ